MDWDTRNAFVRLLFKETAMGKLKWTRLPDNGEDTVFRALNPKYQFHLFKNKVKLEIRHNEFQAPLECEITGSSPALGELIDKVNAQVFGEEQRELEQELRKKYL